MPSLTARQLTQAEISSIVRQKLSWILQSCDPDRVILFGSAARGEMTEASDVDLIVIFANRELKEQAAEKLWKNRPANDWPHDLIMHTQESFRESCAKGGGASWLAAREGTVLHEKGTAP